MALHKSREEIRRLPYPEWKEWKLFYSLEPFGWGAHHALLYNINRGEGVPKSEDDLLNERAEEFIRLLMEVVHTEAMDPETRKQYLIAQARRTFGEK